MLKLRFEDFWKQYKLAKRTENPTMHYEEYSDMFILYFNFLKEHIYYCSVMKDTIISFGESYRANAEQAISDWKMEYLYDAIELDTPEVTGEVPESEEISKELNPGSDVVAESDSYADFYVATVNQWKNKTLKAIEFLEIDKSFNYTKKDFGKFLKTLMSGINSAVFLRVIKRYIKKSMLEGVASVEDEENAQIGFTFAMNERLKTLEAQELNGYRMPDGKAWGGIKGATKELQFNILKTVEEGVKDKISQKELAKRVGEVFDGSTKAQAKRIARTETTRFINEGKMAGYREVGITHKSWNAVGDSKTSEIDKRLDAKYRDNPIPIDDLFVDDVTGKHYMYPPSHPNCRCVISGRRPKL